MLKKLLKHEFKATSKWLIPLELILVLITILGTVLIKLGSYSYRSLPTFFIIATGSCLMIYIIGIIALFVIMGVFLTIRFYKTMYSNQGYLTHTLPVSTTDILNTKILVSVFWVLLTSALTALSVLFLIQIVAGDVFTSYEWTFSMSNVLGLGYGESWLAFFLSAILACFDWVLMVYVSLSIGQLSNGHRILAAAGTFVGIFILRRIVEIVLLVVFGIGTIQMSETEAELASTAASSQHILIWGDVLKSLLFCILFYFICRHITTKRLNLE